MNTATTNKDNDFDPQATVPMSARMPVKLAYQLSLYAEHMNQSVGKVLTSILEDVLPAFTAAPKDGMVRVRLPQAYEVMKQTDLLQAVNTRELRERVLQRVDSGNNVGRPRKSRV